MPIGGLETEPNKCPNAASSSGVSVGAIVGIGVGCVGVAAAG
jgi:hypothetical protein